MCNYFVFAYDHYDTGGPEACRKITGGEQDAIEVALDIFAHQSYGEISIEVTDEGVFKTLWSKFSVDSNGKECVAFGSLEKRVILHYRETSNELHRYHCLPRLSDFEITNDPIQGSDHA